MGGEITWECMGGGQYIITLKVYRDCQGPPVFTVGQSIRIWGHPSMSVIPISLVSQTDISPACTQVPGGPAPISCAGGNPGAIEEYVFQTPLVFIGGVPPAQGYAFTYDSFSRNLALDNLVNPANVGITLRAIMFPYNATNGNPCYDTSPQFLERLSPTICAGIPHIINHNAFDPDGDSLVFSFAEPLDRISTSTPAFNPPASPIPVPFVPGFSYTNPTPDATIAAGNVGATINPQSGDISFTSVTQGNYVIVIKVESWRCGQKISEVYREMQMVITACAPNAAPVVTGPFAGSFSTSVVAGGVVNFSLTATDNGTQPNGAPQVITITPTGGEFGAGFTNAAVGCNAPPCAVLNTGGPYSGTGSVTVNFSWQTNCSHIQALACGATSNVHNFVFKVQDDACPVPAIRYYTVSVTVLPPVSATAAAIHCADVALNGDVTLTWDPAIDPGGNFTQYEIYYNGLMINTIPTIATTTFTHIGADAQFAPATYFILTRSGCSGSNLVSSDTVTTMYLTVNNPGNGTSVLQWNALHTPIISGNKPMYYIYMEYPLGTWTLIDSVPYGVNTFMDTISTCFDTLNYKVIAVDASGCNSVSSIDGDYFQDMIEPAVPVITFITVDTITGLAQITWPANPSPDTQGYIILQNQNGNWVVIDTVYGITNTIYSYLLSNASGESESYGVSAFDSCWWGNPPGPNTTGMSIPHTTVFLQNTLSICDSSVTLMWNAYAGWPGVNSYDIFASENGLPYVLVATVGPGTLSFLHANLNRGSTYTYLIRANSTLPNVFSLSNIVVRYISLPVMPLFGYLNTATVSAPGQVTVRYTPDLNASVSGYILERSDDGGSTFSVRTSVGVALGQITFTDEASTDEQSYFYRVLTVDSCGAICHISNLGRTIHLSATALSPELENKINWNKYEDWDGNILEYRLYRSINGVYSATPVAVISSTTTSYSDDMYEYILTTGEYCYYVEAVETSNPAFANETSVSNEDCAVQDPLVYIPNAFTPVGDGINDLFIPVISYFDFHAYTMRIFNRWGEVIFETNDYTQGWDGNEGPKPAKEGVYVYVVSFKTGEGKPVDIRGFVTLLRPPKP